MRECNETPCTCTGSPSPLTTHEIFLRFRRNRDIPATSFSYDTRPLLPSDDIEHGLPLEAIMFLHIKRPILKHARV